MRRKARLVHGIALFLLLILSPTLGQVFQPSSHTTQKCLPITIPLCSDIPYNVTMMPNLLRHTTQEDATLSISQYNPLIKVKCSEDIKLFLCTLHAPLCTPVLNQIIEPCRHLCLSAKAGCESLMIKFGFRWPEAMNCDRFPESFCVGENKTSSPSSWSNGRFECPMPMRSSPDSRFSLQLKSAKIEDCSLPCDADNVVPVFLTSNERNVLRAWITVWAVACCLCSLFTVFTFLIDLGRFSYPVRPILYMAVCYSCISCVYMVGVSSENRLSCSTPSGNAIATQGISHLPCVVISLLYYYFSMASSAWWLVLCVCWFLAAHLQWGHESVASLSYSLHSFAWGVPALFSLFLLISESTDGDVLSGICSVGNLRPWSLMWLVVVPQAVSILVGLIFLACGVCSMLRIRTYYKDRLAGERADISKLEKLMLRVSLFALLYALPVAINLGVRVKEWSSLPSWFESLYASRCFRHDRALYGFVSSRESCPKPDPLDDQPDLIFFLTKYASQLLVGVTCAVWVVSLKTIASYRTAYSRLLSKPRPEPVH